MNNHIPLYVQIAENLKEQILEGKKPIGTKFAAEPEFAKLFAVNRLTLRRAVKELCTLGLVKRVHGKGTFVISKTIRNGFDTDHRKNELLSLKDKKNITVLLNDVPSLFTSEVLKGIQAKLDKSGYKLILCETENKNKKIVEYIERDKDSASGFILAPPPGKRDHSYLDLFLKGKIPLVFVDRYLPEFNSDAVVSDNETGGYLATRHLLNLGHRTIAALSVGNATSILERIKGYKKALTEHGVRTKDKIILTIDNDKFESGEVLIEKALKKYPEITAAFCVNDNIGWGCLRKLAELNIKVPEDFSVVSFDNLYFTSKLTPPLTTINQQRYQMGWKSAEILINRAEGKLRGKGKIIRLPVRLVQRKSTGKVRND
ncbi:MAG: GntR family transcriptional regulator [Candidatus Omnitrophota bacterium]